MSERDPNFRPDPRSDPRPEQPPAPVAEIEAEIKAEIAAEMEAEELRARSTAPPNGSAGEPHGDPAVQSDGTGWPDPPPVADPGNAGDGWPDAPPPVADPAAEVLAWLRGEFDDINAGLQGLSNRLSRQEEAVLRIAGSQEAELNSTLAELEGSSAKLRNEAAGLRDTRTELAESLPRLVTEAVQSAMTSTVADAVAEMQGTVAQLGAALAEALPSALAEAVASAPGAVTGAPGPESETDGSEPDMVTQLHEAQDEAAEWFTIVVDEAVRRAVERWLVPAVPPVPGGDGVPARATAMGEAGAAPASAGASGLPAADDVGSVALAAPATAPAGAVGDGAAASGPTSDGDGILTDAPVSHAPSAPERVGVADDDHAPPGSAAPAGVAVSTGETAPSLAPDADPIGAAASPVTCVLPGVAVGPTLAMGVSTALGRARLRRRRRRPAAAPAAGLFRHDPFAGELSRHLERFALARRDLAWRPDPEATAATDGRDKRSDVASSVVTVVAERGGEEVALDLAAKPLALAGPDAADAARALVATFVAAREPSAGRAVVADSLLPPGRPFPGLDRFADLDSAIDDLESEIADRTGTRPPSGRGPERPAVVLVTPPPPPRLAARLTRMLEHGAPHGVTGVIVGSSINGADPVTVDAGGRVSETTPSGAPELAGSRMFCLAPGAAAEVLSVLAAARSDDEPVPLVQVQNEPFPVLTASDPAPIQVRVLGPYRIDVGGEEVRSGLRAKARELLAFYLLHPEGTTLDVATEALWPEADRGRGSEWFWTALGNLRSRLRSVTGTKALKIIERDGDRYRIEPVFDVDLWRFQAALPPPGASTGDPQWAAALQSAADMYDGELLAGVDWAWAEVPREDLRRRAVDVLVSLGATRLVAGDVRGALDILSHAVEVDPVSEQLYRRIMRLHAKQSRPDEVQATFERLTARLSEVDLEPTAESQQLVAELVG